MRSVVAAGKQGHQVLYLFRERCLIIFLGSAGNDFPRKLLEMLVCRKVEHCVWEQRGETFGVS